MRVSMIFSFVLEKYFAHNLADDNILSYARSAKMLLEIPVAKSENAIKLFSDVTEWLLTPTNLNPLLFKKTIKQSNQNSF